MPSEDSKFEKLFLGGDEAVALAALDADVKLGSGYPGTPSTEILETFAAAPSGLPMRRSHSRSASAWHLPERAPWSP